jgi:hypothetical protein
MNRVLTIIIVCSIGLSLFAGETVKLSGQFRHRYEYSAKDFDSDTDANTYQFLRTRLNIAFNPSEDLEAFFQYQDARKMGEESNTLTDASADNLDLHQGFVKMKNLFGKPLDVKLGRFEAVYGPQRLIGAVGWHNFGRSFDGMIFTYHNAMMDVDFINFKTAENSDDDLDVWVRGVYGNLKLENYKTQAFYILDDERGTFGIYANGQIIPGLSHETEFAMQNGEAGGDDLNGLFYALNFTYDLNGLKLSAGYDHVSGDDPDTADNEAFNTLFATNHKYYGFMDYFLNIPSHAAENFDPIVTTTIEEQLEDIIILNDLGEYETLTTSTMVEVVTIEEVPSRSLGLNDMHIKLGGLSMMGIKINAAYHIFTSEFDNSNGNTDFGSEIDLTFIKKYNDNVKFVGGFSMFMPGDLMSGDDNATWAYLMTIVNL